MRHYAVSLVVLALILAVSPLLAQAQDDQDDWQVESVIPLVGFYVPPNFLFIGPDGRHVAAWDRDANALCVVDVPADDSICVPVPPESALDSTPRDTLPPLTWSPDATQIALVGAPFIYFRDTDLSVVNVAEGTLTNLADDHAEGGVFLPTAPNLIVDSVPTWSPDGTLIATERTTSDAAGEIHESSISLIDAATGEARQLANIPGFVPGERDLGTILTMDWSPDGATLAFTTRHPDFNPDIDGLWTVDVESGEPEQLLSLADALDPYRAVYADADAVFVIVSARWSPDGSRLLFWAGDPIAMSISTWIFWIDRDTGIIQPLSQPFEVPKADPRLLYPMDATWSPDGTSLLVAWRMMADPPGGPVASLDPDDDKVEVALQLFDVTTGDSALLGYLPLIPVYPATASWGPENDVLIAGYYLRLAQD